MHNANGFRRQLNFPALLSGWAIFMIFIPTLLIYEIGDSSRFITIYTATAVTIMMSVFTYYTMRFQSKRLDLFHPLFYALWFFYLPQVWFSALYYSDETINLDLPAIANLWDRNESFSLALLVALVGTIGLGFGFIAPVGASFGRKMPRFNMLESSLSTIKTPLQNLFFIGLVAEIMLFVGGSRVFNLEGTIWQYSGVFQFFAWFFTVAVFVSWYAYFQKESGWGFIRLAFIVITILELLTRGSRGTLFNTAILLLAAYQYAIFVRSPGRFLRRLLFIWSPLLIVSLVIGFYFGTAFRSQVFQRSVGQTSVSDALTLSSDIIDESAQLAPSQILDSAWALLSERSRTGLISLSVILTYSEVHRAEEARIGLDNKIVKDIINVFIPRFLLPERATIGGSRHIGEIYYGQPRNSPGQTVFGDLFRELGWGGLLVGMLLMGITYRFLYEWLIVSPEITALRAAIFYLIISLANFESQYSQFYPVLVRAFIFIAILLISLNILSTMKKRLSHRY